MTKSDDFDLQAFLPYLLNQAAEEASLGFQKVYKDRYGLLRSEWRVLFHLGIFGRLTATEIGAKGKVHKTKVSRAVQRLADRRLVARARSEEDRRLEWLELTPAGEKVYQDLRAVAQEYEGTLQTKLSAEEVRVLKGMLGKLARRD
ncbi:MarR family winged helix-turn-helix transcriptional regulator [Shimia sagamensis]|uniref:DNA-binding transcriptional regulator, MarR family n=1 Tax=Shimia sagamensis TaxID=1566352 RepID=A0ABY1P667_9RHOB|nr:MarR family transcriptional regulator [Shimia sagamensis]SMP27440.1 DNA-binding transcriptional regulator, MarR family [Shimia sagamensis]